MGKSLEKKMLKVEKMTLKMLEDIRKWDEQELNRKKGYEPKCKICNSKFQDEIEELYKHGHPFREMTEISNQKGEPISLMACSRHFKNHYPKKQEYLENKKKLENDTIQKAINEYPCLKEILQDTTIEIDYDKPIYSDNDEIIDFERYNRSLCDIFLEDRGFCLTGLRLCSTVPEKEVLDMDEVLYKIDEEFKGIEKYSYKEHEKVDLLSKKFECLKCRDVDNTILIDYLIHALSENIWGLSIEAENFKEIFYQDAQLDNEEMDNILKKLKFQIKIQNNDN